MPEAQAFLISSSHYYGTFEIRSVFFRLLESHSLHHSYSGVRFLLQKNYSVFFIQQNIPSMCYSITLSIPVLHPHRSHQLYFSFQRKNSLIHLFPPPPQKKIKLKIILEGNYMAMTQHVYTIRQTSKEFLMDFTEICILKTNFFRTTEQLQDF